MGEVESGKLAEKMEAEKVVEELEKVFVAKGTMGQHPGIEELTTEDWGSAEV
jgi:hypothetical protein